MTSLKKIFALLLALALLCSMAFAEESEGGGTGTTAATGTSQEGKLDEIATSLERSLNAKIVPEIAINDPGRIMLVVQWVQPSMSFTMQTIDYTALTKDGESYADSTAAGKLLSDLGLDTAEDAATIAAMEAEVAAGTLTSAEPYVLSDDKEVVFTLTNSSTSSADGKFKGALQITAEDEDLKIKGIEGVLTTPMEGAAEAATQKPLVLKSKETCAEEATAISDPDAKAAAQNAYIDKTSYKYTYRNQADFYAGFTKAADNTTVADYYKATPEAENVIQDLTTTINFKVKIVKEEA